MPKTIEDRMTELEGLVYDMPDILNLRFSNVDRKLAEHGEVMARMNVRLGRIERTIETLPRVVAEMLQERDRRFDSIETSLSEILARLPKP